MYKSVMKGFSLATRLPLVVISSNSPWEGGTEMKYMPLFPINVRFLMAPFYDK